MSVIPDWAVGLTPRQREAIAARAWALAAPLLPCLCGADEVESSTHTHMPGVATCPANLRSALAYRLAGFLVQRTESIDGEDH